MTMTGSFITNKDIRPQNRPQNHEIKYIYYLIFNIEKTRPRYDPSQLTSNFVRNNVNYKNFNKIFFYGTIVYIGAYIGYNLFNFKKFKNLFKKIYQNNEEISNEILQHTRLPLAEPFMWMFSSISDIIDFIYYWIYILGKNPKELLFLLKKIFGDFKNFLGYLYNKFIILIMYKLIPFKGFFFKRLLGEEEFNRSIKIPLKNLLNGKKYYLFFKSLEGMEGEGFYTQFIEGLFDNYNLETLREILSAFIGISKENLEKYSYEDLKAFLKEICIQKPLKELAEFVSTHNKSCVDYTDEAIKGYQRLSYEGNLLKLFNKDFILLAVIISTIVSCVLYLINLYRKELSNFQIDAERLKQENINKFNNL